ncbi:MAG: hypothetical protein JSW47_14005, partial [Phycisphaerales bacterium]
MFTIDLLNGQAIPPKGKPGGLVIIAMTAVVPIAVATGMFLTYLNNEVALTVKKKEISECEVEIAKRSDAVKIPNELEEQKRTCSKHLSEVRSS